MTLDNIVEEINKANTIAILTHESPDGDAMGSSLAMYNALSTRLGNKTELVFDEEFFYINEQLKESSSSIRTYLADMDKSNYMKAIGIRENIEISNSIYYILNPMMFA